MEDAEIGNFVKSKSRKDLELIAVVLVVLLKFMLFSLSNASYKGIWAATLLYVSEHLKAMGLGKGKSPSDFDWIVLDDKES